MNGWITIGTELDTKSFDAQIAEVEKKLELLEKVADESDIPKQFRRSTDEARKLNTEIEQTRNKLIDLRKKKDELNQPNTNLLQGLKDVGNETEKNIKKIAKWALAVFGIRSAYNFVRQSVSTLSQYNEQLASDIEYIRFAIASTLQPVIEKIIQFVYKLLQYVNYLAQAWFGVNLFANANAKAMNKAVGSAKELKKQLAGFDEMNVMSDTSGAGGGAGAVAPSVDLTEGLGDYPEWLKTIKDVGQWILDNWEDVVMQLLLIKLLIDVLTGNWLKVVLDFVAFLFIALPKLWDAIKVVIENLQIIFAMIVAWIYAKVITPVKKFFADLWQGIINGVTNAVKWVKDKFQSIVSFFSNLISKIVSLFKTIGTKVGDAVSGAFKAVVNGVLKAIESILNFPIKSINKLIDVINAVPGINISTLPTFKLPRLAKGGIVNMPGRGVPIGGAIAGEAGREAVLPLQDSQVLDEIADAIGRRITLAPTIPVYVGNRMVAKEIRKIEAEDKFAYNG